MASLKRIPREIFDFIVEGVAPNSTKNVADALLFSENQEDKLWRAIFRNDKWIEKAFELGASPALVGPKLGMVGIPGYKDSSRLHILLVTNDWGGDLQYSKDLLFQSLRAGYRYDKSKFKVTLPETRFTTPDGRTTRIPEIVLYVCDAVWPGETIILPKRTIRRLFGKKSVRTQYSFACEKRIVNLQDPYIYGIGGKISEPGALLPICVLHLVSLGKKWQTILRAPKCPLVIPILTDGIRGDIVGWKHRF